MIYKSQRETLNRSVERALHAWPKKTVSVQGLDTLEGATEHTLLSSPGSEQQASCPGPLRGFVPTGEVLLWGTCRSRQK